MPKTSDFYIFSSVKFFLNSAIKGVSHVNTIVCSELTLLADLPIEILGFVWKVVFIALYCNRPFCVCGWKHIRGTGNHLCFSLSLFCTWEKWNNNQQPAGFCKAFCFTPSLVQLGMQLEETGPKPAIFPFHLLLHLCAVNSTSFWTSNPAHTHIQALLVFISSHTHLGSM